MKLDPTTATRHVSPAQFALFRVVFGGCLAGYFALELRPTALGLDTVVSVGLVGLFAALALGWFRRTVAALLGLVWVLSLMLADLLEAGDCIAIVSALDVGVLFLCCAVVPLGEPWSVWGARGRRPSEWRFPAVVYWGAWLSLAGGYAFCAVERFPRPGCGQGAALAWITLAVELLFLPLSYWRAGRAFVWTAMLVLYLGFLVPTGVTGLGFGIVMLHLFTFDAAWLPGRRDARQPVLLYDGECGLCNAVVRLLLREDAAARMHFAPLQSEPAQAYLRAQGLPTADFDSLVFVPDWSQPASARPLLRTSGVCAALAEVGGMWGIVSWLRVLPAVVRDPAYRLVARTRYALFGAYRPTPLPDPEWARRMVG